MFSDINKFMQSNESMKCKTLKGSIKAKNNE